MSRRLKKVILFLFISISIVQYSHAQFLYPSKDTLLKPDVANVVRKVYADSVVFSYYCDWAHEMLRNRFVYQLDKSDSREIVFIRSYCYTGQKALEETYKNYNRKLVSIDTGFTISSIDIAYYGQHPDPLIDAFYSDPFRQYSQVGASLRWYCNGNRKDSAWYFPSGKFLKYQSFGGSETLRYKRNVTYQVGVAYSWYESGNVAEERFFENGVIMDRYMFSDSPKRIIILKHIDARNENATGAINLSCLYFDNGNLRDSTIFDAKTKEELERYEFYESGLRKRVVIHRPGFEVFESYDSAGRPSLVERKALYKDKWYECKQRWYENGQLMESAERKQFYALHPEYGNLPDSLIYLDQSYLPNGTRTFYKYTLKNGDTHVFIYRENATLKKSVFFNSKKLGTETEYDENGVITSQTSIDLNAN